MVSLILMLMFMLFLSFMLYFLNLMFCKKLMILRSKSSSFECGFEVLESNRLPFSIHFYLISILFLIFDIEIIYLFPMILMGKLFLYKIWFFCSLMILLILYLGLEYEKLEGSLKWFI